MDDRFLRLPEVLALFPVSKSSLWRFVSEGRFPKPHKLSQKCTAWRLSEVQAHLQKIGGAQ
ncbi:AlpA family phage regulatory protein [Rhodoferax sp.]|uniref:helix-turn-helix transcriptional regulator n=1 Tax=Rhodoferax sp. TaxID=50421 RepID=UPI00344B5BE2